MSETQIQIQWDADTESKYKELISKIPLFHRAIAKEVVDKQAVINAIERSSSKVSDMEVVRAFFSEVPMTFYSLMVRLFESVGFDYKKYEPHNKE